MKPLAIIGLDPGTTAGYAILGLDGQVIKTFSAKELSLSETILQVIELCQPLIIATDKQKVPFFVEEFSRKLGTELVFPEEDLKREEKRNLVLEYKKEINGHHEEDSLAAALFAYQKYLPKLKKIDFFIEENNLEEKREQFTQLALKNELNFSLLKDLLTKKAPEHKIMKEVMGEERITKKDFLVLYEKLSVLKKEKAFLEKKVSHLKQNLKSSWKTNLLLEKRTTNFNKKLDDLLKFKEQRLKLQEEELNLQKKRVEEQNEKIDSLYQFIERTNQLRLLKRLNTLSKKEFSDKNKLLNIKENDFLLVENPNIFSEEVLKQIRNKGITLLSPQKIGKAFSGFQTIKLTEKIPHENEYFALIEEKQLQIENKDIIEKIIGEYKNRKGD